MLQRADINGTRPVILVEATTPAAALGQTRQESLDRLYLLMLGKEYQAQVLSRLSDGSFLVNIDDAPANMKLPPGTMAGDVLDLTLLANQPRPTFLLGKAEGGATTSLSNAGRLIGILLLMAQEDGAAPAAVIGKTPLLAGPNAPAPQIAHALQNALAFSGLFYESHVAQWIKGTRPLAELAREPAAKRLNAPLGSMPAASTEADADTKANPAPTVNDLNKLLTNVREWVDGDRALTDLLRLSHAGQADGADAPARRQDAVGNDGVRLISLQLDTLEQRRVVWQGELFPGQPFEWEVADDTPQKNNGRDTAETEPAWSSSVRFSLPTLGTVAATVRLSGEHVHVQIGTASEASAAMLRSHGSMLADALGAAGTTLDSLLVKQDG
jgi:hypothetical protein